MAEAARAESNRLAQIEKEIARQRELTEQRRQADELKAAAERRKAQEEAARVAANPPATTTGTTTAIPPAVTPNRSEITNTIGMVLVGLPSGMWVGKYEVTQAEYRKVMGTNPSRSVNDRQPVERVSWNDAVEFTRKLTELERGRLPPGKVYELPTERQWKEYGGGQRFEDLAGGGLNSKGAGPFSVGESGPGNKFGIFDVLGNVWEWCRDEGTGDAKLLKGGAFNSANYERWVLPDKQVSNCGFRCILAGD
jgi:formylglycine-generating enzyme required for sulfatase activity